MKNRAFHFEIKNLLTQFVAAFDDVVISRGIIKEASEIVIVATDENNK